MRKLTIGFDVYGTLVDPIEISNYLQNLIGNKSNSFVEIWRQKQLEYTYRRGLMKRYQNFDVCIQQAMQYTMKYLDISLSEKETTSVLNLYKTLHPFSDAAPALQLLEKNNYTLVAFSNGTPSTLTPLLANANLLDYLEDIISVDTLQTFKPNPKVYEYLATKTDNKPEYCWLVSSNPFDVIGAKAVGLKTAWIQRNPSNIFDPWDYTPDITAKNLIEFVEYLK
ncbi:MAG: haloacid dehalogenase type II [Gammaproteobacteria bacterium]